ncbi:hypothetical protein TSAR_000025 [Trichomalopsis sarcophagae]|uniref:Uncharacterized protein n=1 Tax=Trichomalopsis sarcophagae TaxID=543379 RepID=A0A232ESY4_9HYME|nr:hypothetical protein TSAR_000025 [Trichomalopsis sarcophagae]
MWTVLAEQLNQVGPSQKDVAGWQESWKKMRLNAKLNKATFLKALNRTGHDTPDAELNENDERISQIYGTYGMSIGRELGFKRIESNNCVYNCSFQSWKKMRLNAKLNKATFLKALNRTGHDTPDAELNENDERISQIYGTYGTGMSIRRELGFKRIESNNCGEFTHYLLQFKMCFNLKKSVQNVL